MRVKIAKSLYVASLADASKARWANSSSQATMRSELSKVEFGVRVAWHDDIDVATRYTTSPTIDVATDSTALRLGSARWAGWCFCLPCHSACRSLFDRVRTLPWAHCLLDHDGRSVRASQSPPSARPCGAAERGVSPQDAWPRTCGSFPGRFLPADAAPPRSWAIQCPMARLAGRRRHNGCRQSDSRARAAWRPPGAPRPESGARDRTAAGREDLPPHQYVDGGADLLRRGGR